MNNRKLNQLFNAAKNETPPAPNEGFAFLVMRQIQSDTGQAEPTVSDVLGMWFPRLAVVAAVLIGICVISEAVLTSDAPSLSESAALLSAPLVAEN